MTILKTPNITKIEYRGFELEAHRSQDEDGNWMDWYLAIRSYDGSRLINWYSRHEHPLESYLEEMKETIDEYLKNPKKYERINGGMQHWEVSRVYAGLTEKQREKFDVSSAELTGEQTWYLRSPCRDCGGPQKIEEGWGIACVNHCWKLQKARLSPKQVKYIDGILKKKKKKKNESR